MTIYIRSTPGARQGGDLVGPYEETRLKELRQYAQNLSAATGGQVEAYWVCGRRRPMLLAMYRKGSQMYPRTRQEERQLENVSSCITRPGAVAKSQERSPREITAKFLSKARKLPGRFACPAKIVTSQPLQEFAMPRAVQPTDGEQVLSQIEQPAMQQPITFGPAPWQTLSIPGNWDKGAASGPGTTETP